MRILELGIRLQGRGECFFSIKLREESKLLHKRSVRRMALVKPVEYKGLKIK